MGQVPTFANDSFEGSEYFAGGGQIAGLCWTSSLFRFLQRAG
jgi:hypothetical protein